MKNNHPDRTTPPKVSHFSEIALAPEKVEKINERVDLHIVNYGELPVSRLTMLWNGGLLDYSDQAAATIMPSLLREGLTSMNAMEIAELFDFYGATIAHSLSNHHLGADLLALNSSFGRLLPVLAQMDSDAIFPENAVEAAARRASASRATMLSRVAFRASTGLKALMQGTTHPASKVITPEEFASVTRESLTEAYKKLGRSHVHVFVGGRISDELYVLIREVFEALAPLPEEAKHNKGFTVEPYRPEPPQRIHIEMPDSVQSAVSIGIPTIGRDHPDYIPLRLAVMGLGGYFGSRLMKNIREEKGLTYGIDASLLGSYEGAYATVNAQCDNRFVDRVVDETIKEIEGMASNPPTGDELLRLKLHQWNALASATDSSLGKIEHYITNMVAGIPDGYFDLQLKAIEQLTPDTISRVASEYLKPEKISVVTAGI